MIREILQESSVAQGWWEEGERAGRERGREEGRQEGQMVGRDQGRRELARLALEDRFGTLDADEEAALGAADTETLRAVVVNLAADSRERVRARLGLS